MNYRLVEFLFFTLLFCSCHYEQKESGFTNGNKDTVNAIEKLSMIILGNVQDGGSPHIGCKKECCQHLFITPDQNRKVVSIGIIDPENGKTYLFEATPDFTSQLRNLRSQCSFDAKETTDGIFLTHAHIGHYTGLMYLGKEALGSKDVRVYAMPRMKLFLTQNGPWSQLVNLNNIKLEALEHKKPIILSSSLKVTPFQVPHRDEFSETVGYLIEGPRKHVIFIPDIDKWEKWDTSIIAMIAKADYAFIDGTFYDGSELTNRKISEVPHPFIIESMEKFRSLTPEEKNKIYFIHFNHTNPALNPESEQTKTILNSGFHLARMNMRFEL